MKYFKNYPYTVESLKAEFRALSLSLHPDKGGNADEFKAMSAEYYDILKNVDGTTAREAEEARQRAEEARREREEREREAREYEARERARREQEEREEAERIRKAQEVTAAAVRAWAGILERIPEAVTGKKRAYDFADDKSRAAYVAATKRNIKAVINHYFPGLKVSVSISGRIWREEFTISWQDGPSIKELRETCKELEYFIPTSYHSDPYADYGDYRERKGSAPWREAYGQALGDVTDIEYTRGLSDEGKQQAETLAAEFFANFDPKSDLYYRYARLAARWRFRSYYGGYNGFSRDLAGSSKEQRKQAVLEALTELRRQWQERTGSDEDCRLDYQAVLRYNGEDETDYWNVFVYPLVQGGYEYCWQHCMDDGDDTDDYGCIECKSGEELLKRLFYRENCDTTDDDPDWQALSHIWVD